MVTVRSRWRNSKSDSVSFADVDQEAGNVEKDAGNVEKDAGPMPRGDHRVPSEC